MLKLNFLRPLVLGTVLIALVSILQASTSVAQFGISWTFDRDYPTGQYANGDYYVVAPSGLTITSISPASTISGGRTINGSMVNPVAGPSANQGFDSLSTTFLASLNAGRPRGSDMGPGNYLVMPASSSIISTRSDPAALGGNRPTGLDAAVLTVVSAAPSAGSMRPPYCGTDKTAYWNKSSLDYGILSSLAPVAGTPPLSTCENYFQRPWIEVVTDYQGTEIHPQNNQPFYGREMAYQIGDAILRLQLNDSNAAKETLYVRLCQYGIDIFGAAKTADWWADGGHDLGRKAPMLLAGLAFHDSNILSFANGTGLYHGKFQEDAQTFYVNAELEATPAYTADGNKRSSYAPKSANVTISNGSPAVISWAGHGLNAQMPIIFTTTGTLPSGLVAGRTYWVSPNGLAANSFQVSAIGTYDGVPAGASINTTSAGNGTHTATFNMRGVADWIIKGYVPLTWGAQYAAANWDSNYRDICTTSIMGHVLAARLITGAMSTWNWQPLFDYTDRAILVNPGATTGWANQYSNFAKKMWDAYRGATPPPPVVPPTGVTAPTHAVININPVDNGTPVTGSPAFGGVDTQGVATSTTSSVSITLVSGMNAGDRVLLVYSGEGGDPVSSVTDSSGNTYALVKSQGMYNDATLLTSVYSAHVANALAPGAKINVNLTASHYTTKSWFVCKLTGCASGSQPNQTAGNSTYGLAVSAAAAPLASSSVLFGVVKARTSETYSGSAWTALGSQDSGASRSWFLTKSASGTGTQDVGGSLSGNQIYSALWVGFN